MLSCGIMVVIFIRLIYDRYVKAVQSTTLDSVPRLISGYLGYTSSHYGIDSESISLTLYADPKYVASE